MTHQLWLADEAATLDLGRTLARVLGGGGILHLTGTLGAGKTTFTRGLLHALGHSGAVKSPTYTLVEPYQLNDLKVFHFDLYRLGDPEELEYMGIRDYFSEQNLCIVEWPEKGAGVLPAADITIALVPAQGGRHANITAHSPRGETMLRSQLEGNSP